MKYFWTIIVLFFLNIGLQAQNNCLDAIVTQAGDTIFGKTVDVTDSSYTFDSYNIVVSISKSFVKDYIPCAKAIAKLDLLANKNVDDISDYELRKNTSGDYLRRAAKLSFVSVPIVLVGAGVGTYALVGINNNPALKWSIFSASVAVFGGGLYMLFKSFYFIDKAGKLIDLERSAIYLDNGGRVGILWKF